MISLKQVAALAGVSTSTVSRALAAPERLHPKTLEKVKEALESLDYVPYAPARVLRSGRSQTIGIVAPTLMNELYARAVDTLEDEFLRIGYTGLLTCHRDNPDLELTIVRTLIERRVDGLALIGTNHHPDLLAFVRKQKLPYVLMWATDGSAVHPSVGYDNRLAMARIVEHLVQLGHKRFAVLPGPVEVPLAATRLQGVRQALRIYGIQLQESGVIPTGYDPVEIRDAVRQLMQAKVRPSALVCGNDMLAATALAECRDLNIDVPSDLSITGFGDWNIASLTYPTLTTIRSDAVRIGKLSAQNLLRQISEAATPNSHQDEFEADLIVRRSTARAA
jgi:LacI family transcriptional regulator